MSHVHTETEMMPVKNRSQMLSKQFLLSTQTVNHPNFLDLFAPPPKRTTKPSLVTCFGEEIKQISKPNLKEPTYKKLLKKIHTKSVKDAINNLGNNKVLEAKPPKVNKAEIHCPEPQDQPCHSSTLALVNS